MIYNNLDVGIWFVDVQCNKVIVCLSGVSNIYGEDVIKFLEDRDLWESFIYFDDKLVVEKVQYQL